MTHSLNHHVEVFCSAWVKAEYKISSTTYQNFRSTSSQVSRISIFFVKTKSIQGGEYGIRAILLVWPRNLDEIYNARIINLLYKTEELNRLPGMVPQPLF